MSNVQKLAEIFSWMKSVYEAVFKGGDSMLYKESLQFQIDRAGERTWKNRFIIGPFKGADNKDYFTTPVQQARFDALALGRIEGQLSAMKSVLDQVAQAANKGVPVNIDYAKIEAMMPKLPAYEVSINPVDPKEGTK